VSEAPVHHGEHPMSVFHIHVDASELQADFEDYLAKTGFSRTDFAGHPEGIDGFEPPNHLTLKMFDSAEFRKTFDAVQAEAMTGNGMRGYLEGEFIPVDQDIAERPYREGVAIPFKVKNGPPVKGVFRETEIHITMDRDRSDARLLAALTEMGFFSAFMRKAYGLAQIFTVQGSRAQIDQLLPNLIEFLESCGGAVHCSVKEERVARWWLSHSDVALPPVITEIQSPV
jgi:hypothetical protein